MRYLLDTDVVINLLRNEPSALERLVRLEDNRGLSVSVITVAEYSHGAHRSAHPRSQLQAFWKFIDTNRVDILDVTTATALTFAEHQSKAASKSQKFPAFDLLIAATCLFHGMTLVTGNQRDFQRIPGLLLA